MMERDFESKLGADILFKVSQCRANKTLAFWTFSSFLILIVLPVRANLTSVAPNPNNGFTSYEIRNLSLHLLQGGNEKEIFDTRLENGRHVDEVILRFVQGDKDLTIDLKLNNDLIPQSHFLKYKSPSGTDNVQHFNTNDIDLCHYKGTIRNINSSQVAISTCNGIKGIIFDGIETYYIDTERNGHFLYRNFDQTKNSTCGFNDQEPLLNVVKLNSPRHKRSVDDIVRGPYNANSESLYVELVLVVDHAIYESLDKNLENVHMHCKDVVNIVNSAFDPLNIFIALVGVVVWNEGDEMEMFTNASMTLENFLDYRLKVLSIEHPNDIAYLLTKQKFDDNILGQAYALSICTYMRSGGIVSDTTQVAGIVAQTVTHELGHNFGMTHDTSDCECKDCIMATKQPTASRYQWSSCSIDQLNYSFQRGMTHCLRNKPYQLFDIHAPECGNGFVEPGEQCDCGIAEFCENSCCNAKTCTLHSNASCATGECCDLATCRPHNVGTLCRPSVGDCDIPEHCTGESEYCPDNGFKRDTELCGGGKAYCYEGACQSHTDQCKLLWGENGESLDTCYSINLDGDLWGNCGYNWQNFSFQKCSEEDILCGVLQCQFTENRLSMGNQLLSYELSHEVEVDDRNFSCKLAFVGLQIVDPGLSPNGAICGDGKMCIQQKCMSIENLRASGIGVDCPGNCSGHGICDNKGRCRCENGYLPPLCEPSYEEGLDTIETDSYGTESYGTESYVTESYVTDSNETDSNGTHSTETDSNETEGYGTNSNETNSNETDISRTYNNETDSNGTVFVSSNADGLVSKMYLVVIGVMFLNLQMVI